MENQFYKVETNIPEVGTIYITAPNYVTCIKILINSKDIPESVSQASIHDINICTLKVLREAE